MFFGSWMSPLLPPSVTTATVACSLLSTSSFCSAKRASGRAKLCSVLTTSDETHIPNQSGVWCKKKQDNEAKPFKKASMGTDASELQACNRFTNLPMSEEKIGMVSNALVGSAKSTEAQVNGILHAVPQSSSDSAGAFNKADTSCHNPMPRNDGEDVYKSNQSPDFLNNINALGGREHDTMVDARGHLNNSHAPEPGDWLKTKQEDFSSFFSNNAELNTQNLNREEGRLDGMTPIMPNLSYSNSASESAPSEAVGGCEKHSTIGVMLEQNSSREKPEGLLPAILPAGGTENGDEPVVRRRRGRPKGSKNRRLSLTAALAATAYNGGGLAERARRGDLDDGLGFVEELAFNAPLSMRSRYGKKAKYEFEHIMNSLVGPCHSPGLPPSPRPFMHPHPFFVATAGAPGMMQNTPTLEAANMAGVFSPYGVPGSGGGLNFPLSTYTTGHVATESPPSVDGGGTTGWPHDSVLQGRHGSPPCLYKGAESVAIARERGLASPRPHDSTMTSPGHAAHSFHHSHPFSSSGVMGTPPLLSQTMRGSPVIISPNPSAGDTREGISRETWDVVNGLLSTGSPNSGPFEAAVAAAFNTPHGLLMSKVHQNSPSSQVVNASSLTGDRDVAVSSSGVNALGMNDSMSPPGGPHSSREHSSVVYYDSESATRRQENLQVSVAEVSSDPHLLTSAQPSAPLPSDIHDLSQSASHSLGGYDFGCHPGVGRGGEGLSPVASASPPSPDICRMGSTGGYSGGCYYDGSHHEPHQQAAAGLLGFSPHHPSGGSDLSLQSHGVTASRLPAALATDGLSPNALHGGSGGSAVFYSHHQATGIGRLPGSSGVSGLHHLASAHANSGQPFMLSPIPGTPPSAISQEYARNAAAAAMLAVTPFFPPTKISQFERCVLCGEPGQDHTTALVCTRRSCQRLFCLKCVAHSNTKPGVAVFNEHVQECIVCVYQSRKRALCDSNQWHFEFKDESDGQFVRMLRDMLPLANGLFIEISRTRQPCWRRKLRNKARKHFSFRFYGGIFESRLEALDISRPKQQRQECQSGDLQEQASQHHESTGSGGEDVPQQGSVLSQPSCLSPPCAPVCYLSGPGSAPSPLLFEHEDVRLAAEMGSVFHPQEDVAESGLDVQSSSSGSHVQPHLSLTPRGLGEAQYSKEGPSNTIIHPVAGGGAGESIVDLLQNNSRDTAHCGSRGLGSVSTGGHTSDYVSHGLAPEASPAAAPELSDDVSEYHPQLSQIPSPRTGLEFDRGSPSINNHETTRSSHCGADRPFTNQDSIVRDNDSLGIRLDEMGADGESGFSTTSSCGFPSTALVTVHHCNGDMSTSHEEVSPALNGQQRYLNSGESGGAILGQHPDASADTVPRTGENAFADDRVLGSRRVSNAAHNDARSVPSSHHYRSTNAKDCFEECSGDFSNIGENTFSATSHHPMSQAEADYAYPVEEVNRHLYTIQGNPSSPAVPAHLNQQNRTFADSGHLSPPFLQRTPSPSSPHTTLRHHSPLQDDYREDTGNCANATLQLPGVIQNNGQLQDSDVGVNSHCTEPFRAGPATPDSSASNEVSQPPSWQAHDSVYDCALQPPDEYTQQAVQVAPVYGEKQKQPITAVHFSNQGKLSDTVFFEGPKGMGVSTPAGISLFGHGCVNEEPSTNCFSKGTEIENGYLENTSMEVLEGGAATSVGSCVSIQQYGGFFNGV